MPRLTGSAVSLAALFGGSWTLFIQDRYRRIWWLILIFATIGWWLYFGQWREPWLRIVLEVASVTFIIGLMVRLWYRVVVLRRLPAGYVQTRLVLKVLRPYLMNRVTLVIYAITATFVTLHLRGKATFSAQEYGVAFGALFTWLLCIFCWRRFGRSFEFAKPENGTRVSFEGEEVGKEVLGSKCPLGF